MSNQTKIAVYLKLLRLVIDERGTLTRYHPPIIKCLTGIFAYGFTPIEMIFFSKLLVNFDCFSLELDSKHFRSSHDGPRFDFEIRAETLGFTLEVVVPLRC